MEKEMVKIQAIGNLLNYYYSDLRYILKFRQLKRGESLQGQLDNKVPGSLRSFIVEYRVARGIRQGSFGKFAEAVRKWVNSDEADDVDGFAEQLRKNKITQPERTMVSLASKVLFLNNPQVLLPCDAFNRRGIGITAHSYGDFKIKVDELRTHTELWIDKTLTPVQQYLRDIESQFDKDFHDLATIRRSRFLDKLLWTSGQHGFLARLKGRHIELMPRQRKPRGNFEP